ncbi:hypothetical protein HZB94_01865 [Candidatus Falkowbacteria bacterium]|nr:hypothetical protein [Candidatus Falkowbacteria bacterium]
MLDSKSRRYVKSSKSKRKPRKPVRLEFVEGRRQEMLAVNVVGDRIEISDYSSTDDRERVLTLLSVLGVKASDVNESWCG